jgi:hypothetical protein
MSESARLAYISKMMTRGYVEIPQEETPFFP